jgi:hypothetical protein
MKEVGKKKKGKYIKVSLNINEGWDGRAWDKKLHYFVRNRSICNSLIRYHPPYFDAGFIPYPDDIEIDDYCIKCVQLMRYREQHLDLKRFFK